MKRKTRTPEAPENALAAETKFARVLVPEAGALMAPTMPALQ